MSDRPSQIEIIRPANRAEWLAARKPGNGFVDHAGKRFGRLTVLERSYTPGPVRWLCRCDCGREREVLASRLCSGGTRSCGCLIVEATRQRSTTHGGAGRGKRSPEYGSWRAMKERCLNPNSEKYPQYGAAGISVCERWKSFENFLADMGRKPSPQHTVDRVDNAKGYEPGNCRWATASEQRLNQRRVSRQEEVRHVH